MPMYDMKLMPLRLSEKKKHSGQNREEKLKKNGSFFLSRIVTETLKNQEIIDITNWLPNKQFKENNNILLQYIYAH